MAHGGARVGSGRRKKAAPEPASQNAPQPPQGARLTPLEYMLAVMNDPEADPARRDRMALAAAPFVHRKGAEYGKKELADLAAGRSTSGRFAPGRPPGSAAADWGDDLDPDDGEERTDWEKLLN